MNSIEALAAIDKIAATSSKNDKEALVEKFAKDPLFRKILAYALDPFVTFGVAEKSIPKVTEHGANTFDERQGYVWDTLDLMASRALTGNAAQVRLFEILSGLDETSASVVRRILLKDLRAGFTKNTVNRVFPGMIPSFDCMLAHKFDAKRVKTWPVAVEPKLDGVRVLAFVDGKSAAFYSRSGKEFTTFDHLKKPLIDTYNVIFAGGSRIVLDGEVVSGSFNKTVSEVRRKDEQASDAKFYVFDLLPAALFNEDTKVPSAGTYELRRKSVEVFVDKAGHPICKLPSVLATNEAAVMANYTKFREKGLEGAIVKPLDGLYHRKRNHAWMKLKAEESADIVVTGAFEGEGKYQGMLGGLLANFNGVEVSIGGGFSDEQRRTFWEAWTTEMKEQFLPGQAGEIVGRLIEVEYHEVTPDGSLRHPRFVRFRDDKPVAEAA
jgi:DNA ligase-1